MGTAPITAVALALASLGFGSLVLGFATRDTRPRLDAISAVTGLSVLSTIAGGFVAANAYSIGAAWALMIVGGACLVVVALRARREPQQPSLDSSNRSDARPRRSIPALLIAGTSFLLIAVTAFAGLHSMHFNACDDWPSYIHLPRLMLETGGFVEPFSLRRMSALGPVQFLQSLFWRDLGIATPGVSDLVVGQVLLWAAVRRLPTLAIDSDRETPPWLGEGLALAALVISFTLVFWNATPVLLPAVGTLVLIMTSHELIQRRAAPDATRLALAWGFIAAWLIATRLNGAPFPAMLWLIAGGFAVFRRNPSEVRLVVASGVGTGLGLLPWCVSLWRSSGTPLFPLFAGNLLVPDLNVADLDPIAVTQAVGQGLMDGRVWALVVCAALAGLHARHRALAMAVVASILVMMAATTATSTGFERLTTYRYSASFALGYLFYFGFVAACALGDRLRDGPPAQARGVAIGGLVALGATSAAWFVVPFEHPRGIEKTIARHSNLETFVANVKRRRGEIQRGLERSRGEQEAAHYVFRDAEAYARAQQTLPADARVVSATTFPFLLRFDQQTIHTLDLLGIVGPDPGWPIGKGTNAMGRYLLDLGYTHLAFSPSNRNACLYNLPKARRNQQRDEPYLRKLAPRLVDVMQNTNHLARTRRLLFRDRRIVVIDLQAPRARAQPTGR